MNVVAKAYAEEIPVTLTSDHGHYDKEKNIVHLKENVVATTEDGTRLLRSDERGGEGLRRRDPRHPDLGPRPLRQGEKYRPSQGKRGRHHRRRHAPPPI